jgi:hypothetical protein
VFCTTRKHCETQAEAFSELLADGWPAEWGVAGALGVSQSCIAADDGSQAGTLHCRYSVDIQRLALDLAAAQGGEISEPLQTILARGTGVAYHHAGGLRYVMNTWRD